MVKFFAGLFGKSRPQTTGPDEFPLSPDLPDQDLHLQISEYLQRVVAANPGFQFDVIEKMAAEHPIMIASPNEQIRMVLALAARMDAWYGSLEQNRTGRGSGNVLYVNYAFEYLFSRLVRRSLTFTGADLLAVLRAASHVPGPYIHHYSWAHLLNHVEKLKETGPLEPALQEALQAIRVTLEQRPDIGKGLLGRLDVLAGQSILASVEPFEPWSDALLKDLSAFSPEARLPWEKLIAYALDAPSSKPGPKWFGSGQAVIDDAGREVFLQKVREWFSIAAQNTGKVMPERSADLLRGLVLLSSLYGDSELGQIVGDLGIACYLKIPAFGPRSKKVGNACVTALSAMPGMVGIHALARIRQKAKYSDVHAWIGEALESTAKRLGMTSGDLEDLSVPDYGLDISGQRRETFGDVTAVLSITPGGKAQVAWTDPSGKQLKSVPAAVKHDHAEEYTEFIKTAEAAEQTLSAQRDRLERALIQPRTWQYAGWRARFIEHPFLFQLARRLVWHFQEGERSAQAIWQDGRLTGVDGAAVDGFSPGALVQLWHPLGFPAETVRQWRQRLEEVGVIQPFKQAYREIYVLTAAELDTHTYSNRFAAHILKQHQLAALCRQRGWTYALQGGWDSNACAELKLPPAGLKVQFFVQGVYVEDQLAGSGACLYVSTDQVRFIDSQNRNVPLTEIPALLFSEVMRDVDLFVSVCSVGADPTWRDQTGLPAYAAYWERFAFGDLTASAETRRDALERLLPRLKIATRCEIQGRYLIVRGKRYTYKIHLGSSNILMEPNDRYLCIVPSPAKAGKDGFNNFLPFEGDNILSLILSKAFLLAEDDIIRDPAILRQIEVR